MYRYNLVVDYAGFGVESVNRTSIRSQLAVPIYCIELGELESEPPYVKSLAYTSSSVV